jgi:hypothetical protein
MKRVLIATPCLDQKVDAYFVHSLTESIRLGIQNDLDIKCVFLANESILPMARNELLNLAYTENYDDLVFIDDDEHWDPRVLIEILLSEKPVITVPVVNKSDQDIGYNVFLEPNSEPDPHDGYLQAEKTGAGFLKISQEPLADLWKSNPSIFFRQRVLKNICEYGFQAGEFIGEDIMLSKKLRELGYTIWVHPGHTVSHVGNKIYQGDFSQQLKFVSHADS